MTSKNSSRSLAGLPYADVLLDLPALEGFTYEVPAALRERIEIGRRVWVPLRNRRVVGIVAAGKSRSAFPGTRPIQGLIDEEILVPPDLIALSKALSEHYCIGWGEMLLGMLPGPVRRGRTEMKSRSPMAVIPPDLKPQPALTVDQRDAFDAVQKRLLSSTYATFLLHGVTGSGKTEVYLQAIRKTLEQGKGCIVLVPEIALTPQTIERFTGRFGAAQVAVLHSHMLDSHRFQEWRRIARKEARIVIGARSAVFAPVPGLGLIVVDEEHETSYKQEEAPRYHAREAAVERCRIQNAVAILGTATPSLESYYRASQGKYQLLQLPERIDRQPMPAVQIVDVRQYYGRQQYAVITPPLERALQEMIRDKQQAIIFLNRRGFATRVQCKGCGATVECDKCRMPMVFHQSTQQMICHTCRTRTAVPDLCPRCKGHYVRFRGTGTQRVESELARMLPGARIARMDTDVMGKRGSHHAILSRFRRQQIDILVGTQMVAKGHDFPQVTLIGIINADTALSLPDFRASERTFDLLTQVSGRAGRGGIPGKVVVQTALPEHDAIQAASRHDYGRFFKEEMGHRKALDLPPVSIMAQLIVQASKETAAKEAAQNLWQTLLSKTKSKENLLGPSPMAIYRLRSRYRWQIIVKAGSVKKLHRMLEPVLGMRRRGKTQVIINVDPVNLW
ncbi:MAG: primosomal protein N' [Candidatus Omnitrophica bacterium]|nr:primosomal protein N' [Candidatus Omnitrophota bacterium]